MYNVAAQEDGAFHYVGKAIVVKKWLTERTEQEAKPHWAGHVFLMAIECNEVQSKRFMGVGPLCKGSMAYDSIYLASHVQGIDLTQPITRNHEAGIQSRAPKTPI